MLSLLNYGGLGRRSTAALMALAVALAVFGATGYTLWRLRAETIERQLDSAAMYARAFEDHLTQTLNAIELTLSNAARGERDSRNLVAALRHAPYLRSLGVIDGSGTVVAASEPRNLGVRLEHADFLPLTAGASMILRVGPPWIGRDFYEGRAAARERPAAPDALTMIPVLRQLPLDEERRVTLAAAVNSDFFLNHYGRSIAAEIGTVELLRVDGMLLLSTDERAQPGAAPRGRDISERFGREEFGQFEQELENGRMALTAFRASRSYPFAIAVHLDKQRALASWRREAAHTLAAVSGAFLTALALASLYFIRMERIARQHDDDVQQLRLRGAALEASANAIIITDRDGVIEWANPAFCALSGYSMEETIGRKPSELIKSGMQRADTYRELWDTILAGKVWRGEMINRRKDGSQYPEDQTITPVRDERGTIRNFIAVKQDVTERKQGEARMEQLSRHLVVVQESTRRRLSGELHDRTSPNLAAIGVNLDIISAIVPQQESPVLSARLDDVRALIEDTTASIREICSDLRPPILDYAGPVAALESYVKQFNRRTGIAVQIECPQRGVRLAPALESVLFRIVQEALTNCAKHSRARSIEVSLSLDTQPLVLTVRDDGVGFNPELLGKTTHTGGLGILTMREMAEFSGGTFKLESLPGSGTRIRVEIDSMEGQS
jgi:PAS domain S-box-containing protein